MTVPEYVADAMWRAEAALVDLGACDDDPCYVHEDGICLSALPRLRHAMRRAGVQGLEPASWVS